MPASSLLVTDYFRNLRPDARFGRSCRQSCYDQVLRGPEKDTDKTLSQLREATEPNIAPPVCFTWPFAVLLSKKFQQNKILS